MFIAHWGLRCSPFAGQLNPEEYYASETHEEALARIQFLIENGRRLGFLLGATGMGKSLLFEILSRQQRQSGGLAIRFNLTGIDASEFAWKLSTGLGHLSNTDRNPVEWWRGIADRLAANRYQKQRTLILLDDADDCAEDVLAGICRVALMEQRPDALLTLIIAAQPQNVVRLGNKINELCELRVDLEPWESDETAAYVCDALVRAGAKQPIFTEEALTRLQALTHGVPRRVRQLAELSLVAGAGENALEIGPEIIDSVHRSLTSRGLSEAA